MNINQAKCIPLERYLAHQGHEPASAKHGGRELWYHSPIRDGDKSPSFKVDTVKNLWYDHGAAQGGTIIQLVTEMFACDVRDALRYLDATGLYSPTLASPQMSRGASRRSDIPSAKLPVAGEKEKGTEKAPFELTSQGPLKHLALLQYLTKRGIDHDVARKYLSEIKFKHPERPGKYFALGYPAGDGFETRNALFKCFVGTGKAVSFHDMPGMTRLQVFEGFMDFLSYLSQDTTTQLKGSVLVLNSTNLWRQALPYINDPRFDEVRLYLDNDDAGDAATRQLFENANESQKLLDMRSYYADYEDLND